MAGIRSICSCQQTLGYIKRNTSFILGTAVRETLFLGLVRPRLCYATQIWALQSIELTAKLERIQRRTTRFILNLPYSSTISYNFHLQTLNLSPLSLARTIGPYLLFQNNTRFGQLRPLCPT